MRQGNVPHGSGWDEEGTLLAPLPLVPGRGVTVRHWPWWEGSLVASVFSAHFWFYGTVVHLNAFSLFSALPQ